MSRRASLPGANELFRTTSSSAALAEASASELMELSGAEHARTKQSPQAQSPAGDSTSVSSAGRGRRSLSTRVARQTHSAPSGRQRHDEKITVYLSSDELVDLDDAKSTLYRDLGIKVDRGRIVREAVAVVVADLQAKSEASILARRLREGLDA
jgi:hypothetical protein